MFSPRFFGWTLAVAALVASAPAPSLIELSTVTAIQGELSSSAAPNYMYALDRTRVNTVRSDLQSISQSLERYRMDNGAYPVTVSVSSRVGPAPGDQRFSHVFTFPRTTPGGPGNLTQPRTYMSTMPTDPYSRPAGRDLPYAYFVDRRTNQWLLWSAGPDNDYDIDPRRDFWSGSHPAANALREREFNPDDPNDTDGDLLLTNRR